jgi:eukaryotic-like serine/threonine-protein kinase
MIGDKLAPQPTAGGTLGHYRIIEKIGAGGMGVVYKGRDTHLDRFVALKVLPPGAVADPESRRRFAQEAKAASALNHPNIITVYDISNTDGVDFIAMEYVEGRTLEQLIGHRRMPLKQVLAYATQIADALGKAHAAGIIHRDLKPSNIMITSEDNVKILDFGLAKLVATSGLVDGEATASTLETLTKEGRLLGTAAYMAPEQAEGKPVDARCDIFSFGLILYEMLTGRRPFGGDTNLAMITAMLHEEPTPPSQLAPGLPAEVERVVMCCLRKDPQRRWQSMPDLKLTFQNLEEKSDSGGFPLTVARRLPFKWLAAGVTIMLLAGFLIGLAVRKTTQPTPSFPVVRAAIKLESGQWLDGMRTASGPVYAREGFLQRPSRTAVAMSKDGRFIVYSAIAENPGPQAKAQLYLRRTDQWEAKPIAGTEGGINPFLSPDDRWVGFWADGKLMKVSVDGGVPVTLCNAERPYGASWALDNSIIFANDESSGLFRVSAEGGNPESLTTPDKAKEEYSHRLAHCLPDGKSVLFTIMREPWDVQPRTALLDLKTLKWRVLMEDAADARYVPTGHLVFLRQGTLMVVPFDLGRREVTGQPLPAIANVMQALNAKHSYYNTAAGQFSISDSGWLVYAEGGILPDTQDSLAWVDHKGKAEAIASFKAPFFGPHLSPDGQRIAYKTIGREERIWVYDLNRGTASQLTGEGRAKRAVWTPDGKRLVFAWAKALLPNLYWQPADGSPAMERLTTSDYAQLPGSWSPGSHSGFCGKSPRHRMGHIFAGLAEPSHNAFPQLPCF